LPILPVQTIQEIAAGGVGKCPKDSIHRPSIGNLLVTCQALGRLERRKESESSRPCPSGYYSPTYRSSIRV
jgi:hypothetical protein